MSENFHTCITRPVNLVEKFHFFLPNYKRLSNVSKKVHLSLCTRDNSYKLYITNTPNDNNTGILPIPLIESLAARQGITRLYIFIQIGTTYNDAERYQTDFPESRSWP